MPIVYLHRKPIDNSIFYVGIGNNKKRAYHFHGRNAHWKNTYNKHSVFVDIVADVETREIANELEEFLIQEIGINNLCNKTSGGDGFKGYHTKDVKDKMSKSRKGMYAGKKRSEYFCEQVRKSKIGYCPSRQAIENGVQKRKEKASLIIELNSGFIGKIWEIEKEFNIDRKAVYYNCKKEKAILTREYKGLNFKKYNTI